MTDDLKPRPKTPNRARARARAAAQMLLDLVASGYERETIARKFGISLSTVRREIERALDERRPDTHQRYIRLQITRLTKALRAADVAIEEGDLKAIDPLVKVIAALDRYQGLAVAPPARRRVARAPAPTLALTHCAPPLAESVGLLRDVAEKGA